MNTRRWFVAGVLFAVLWVFVRGAALTPRSLAANFLTGLFVGLPVAFVFRRLYEEEVDLAQTVGAIPYVVAYVVVFSKEVVVANLDVAYRVLRPTPQFEPQVVLVPLRVQTALGITTIANSITITPGTVTLDHDPDENALYVHMIDGRDPDEVVEPIRVWENYALEIFDEELSPDDPPPEIRVHPPDYPPEPKTAPHEAWGEQLEEDDESESQQSETNTETDEQTQPDDQRQNDDDTEGQR
jgi:multicomponent Na+:H+ antiporter subunit E